MSFIRAEAQDQLWRWRESVTGVAAVIFGVWLVMGGRGIVAIIGAFAVVVGIALIFAGWQRARFRKGRDGEGVVSITEGQITYYGPFTGGAMAVSSITEVILNPLPRDGAIWELRAPGMDPIRIPVNAEGAEALFDVFSSLPGLQTQTILAAIENPGSVPRTIWTRRLLH